MTDLPRNLSIFTHGSHSPGFAQISWEDEEGHRLSIRLAAENGQLARPLSVAVDKKGQYFDGAEGQWIRKRPALDQRGQTKWSCICLDATSAKWAPLIERVLAWAADGDRIAAARAAEDQKDADRQEGQAAEREQSIRDALQAWAERDDLTPDLANAAALIGRYANRADLFALHNALPR